MASGITPDMSTVTATRENVGSWFDLYFAASDQAAAAAADPAQQESAAEIGQLFSDSVNQMLAPVEGWGVAPDQAGTYLADAITAGGGQLDADQIATLTTSLNTQAAAVSRADGADGSEADGQITQAEWDTFLETDEAINDPEVSLGMTKEELSTLFTDIDNNGEGEGKGDGILDFNEQVGVLSDALGTLQSISHLDTDGDFAISAEEAAAAPATPPAEPPPTA
jgi:hypothetical protein